MRYYVRFIRLGAQWNQQLDVRKGTEKDDHNLGIHAFFLEENLL